MIDLTQFEELVIEQKVEYLEAFTGFETENRYRVATTEGDTLLYAFEESGLLGRIFLKSHRPLTLRILDGDSRPVMTARRSFFFFFSHLHVYDAEDRLLGSLQRRFSILKRRFTLSDSGGSPIARIDGPIWRPSTFMMYRNGEEVARVTKQWVGILKEAFTDADTFRVQQNIVGLRQDFSQLVLGAAFAIDLDCFEQK